MELNLARPSTAAAAGKVKKAKKAKKAKKKKQKKTKAAKSLQEARAVADRIGALLGSKSTPKAAKAAKAEGREAAVSARSGATGGDSALGGRKESEGAAAARAVSPSSADNDAAGGGAGAGAKPQDTFKGLGVCAPLCEATAALGWKAPTAIQCEAIPVALSGRDVVGLAETGSGKTGAFAIPVLQALLAKPQRIFACVLAPTRELAMQISEQFEALGGGIGAKTVVLLGGVDMMAQAVLLAKKPHIIVATPGRLVDHLENTKGFNMRQLKFLIMDEADRMLGMDFEEEINKVLEVIPRKRTTFLFSATMTSKVAKLQRASLTNPVKCEVSSKYQTVSTLVQQYKFLPIKYKEVYLAYVLNEFAGQSGVVFVSTCATAQKLTLMLRNLGFGATCLHGQMGQHKRLAALNKFKAGERRILVATDVASRGLDIPTVDLVLNYDVPNNAKDYVHRVGRTARAGRSGRAITFVTQYDVWVYQRIEQLLGKKLPAFPCEAETVLLLLERVTEAVRIAAMEVREMEERKRGRRGGRGGASHDDDADIAARVIRESQMKRKRLSSKIKQNAKRRRR